MSVQIERMTVQELRQRWLVVGWIEDRIAGLGPDDVVVAFVQYTLGSGYLRGLETEGNLTPKETR